MTKQENKGNSGKLSMGYGIIIGILIQSGIIFVFRFSPYWAIFAIQFVIILLCTDLLSEESYLKKMRCKTENNADTHSVGILRYSTYFSLGFSAFVVISLIADDIAKAIPPFPYTDEINACLPIFKNASMKDLIIAFVGLVFAILLTEFSNKINQFNRSKAA